MTHKRHKRRTPSRRYNHQLIPGPIRIAWHEVVDFVRYVRRYREPRIVATPGWLGGRPRLDQTRLGVNFFAAHRHQPREWFAEYWPYLSDKDLAFMFAVVDATRPEDGDDA